MSHRRPHTRFRALTSVVLLVAVAVLASCDPAPKVTCPCTLFDADTTPVTVDAGDVGPVEVGVRFTSHVRGSISAVRFYKSVDNTGEHLANLWTDDGILLATTTFTDESPSGWQQADFPHPVPIVAGTTYIASYHTNTGHYSADHGFFDTPFDHAPLEAPADDGGGEGNGVYRTGASGFPASSYQAANYWVDPVLVTDAADTTPPEVLRTTPTDGATDVAPQSTISARFSEPVLGTGITVTPSTSTTDGTGDTGDAVAGTLSYDIATSNVTFTPSSPLPDGTYDVTVDGAVDLAKNPMTTPVHWSFTVGTRNCPCSLWSDDAVPQNPDAGDATPVEVGTRISSDVAGYLTAVRFYKSTANTGTHVGHVWSSDGTLLGTATFSDETASGWQTATLTNPVAVTPGTSYVVSYFAPDGHYAGDNNAFSLAGVDNPPLHAARDCCDAGNGVYRSGSSGFPTNSYAGTNYWVDVVFDTTAQDTTPPTVQTTTPPNGATGVPVGTHVSATFSEPVDPASVIFDLADDGTSVAGATSYDAESLTATFLPDEPLDPTGTYTATVSGATDTAGNPMDAPVSWTFTPEGDASLWGGGTTPATIDTGPSGPLELGMRFATGSPGSVTGVRFYKSAANTGVHTGSLWTAGGRLLATTTFTDETASGWQQATFDQPVPISVGDRYVISYHTDSGHYSADAGYFADSGFCSGALCAPRDGDGGGNGVFAEGASSFPTSSYGSANYWVDPVFTANAVDTTPPEVLTRGPAPDETHVAANTLVTAGFSEPIVATSVTMTVTADDGTTVPGTTAYDATSRVLTFTPADPLAPSTTYTAHVAGAADPSGNVQVAPDTWTFTTAASVPLEGTGGPILVVDEANGFLPEILRTEGLDLFATATPAELTPTLLADHHVVVLGPTPVTPGQVAALTSWVQTGGHLITMRPDPALAGLVGITPTGTTLTDAYLAIDTSTAAGAGLVADTIQFHGTADLSTLDGASAVATLYDTATHATSAPAVTERTVGEGSVAAFTYDLTTSVIQTRQGNPAWAGQHRIGTSPIRATDLFYGAAANDPQPDWIDPDKVAIPQADEQQRLLANLVTTMDADTEPIPRFWYLPGGADAAVMLTGDDHGHGGTVGRFDQLAALDPPGCSVADWTCPRATSYVFPGTPIPPALAAHYVAEGFDIGLHTSTDCNDFTEAQLDDDFTSQLAQLRARFPDIPAPSSNRTHCVVWSTWAGEPHAEAAHGIRLDANYYWWPPQLASTHPGLFTGSGIPMRFADTDGTLIDVYQVPTQITDESDQPEPSTIDTLLDNATGPLGYYAVIGVNAHTDNAESATADAVVASARARGVPVISAAQLLRWLDGRDRSSFGSLHWDAGTATFQVTADPDAVGLQAMLPLDSPAAPFTAAEPGHVRTITRDGDAVPFTARTVKGIDYAVFTATTGSYTATYGR